MQICINIIKTLQLAQRVTTKVSFSRGIAECLRGKVNDAHPTRTKLPSLKVESTSSFRGNKKCAANIHNGITHGKARGVFQALTPATAQHGQTRQEMQAPTLQADGCIGGDQNLPETDQTQCSVDTHPDAQTDQQHARLEWHR